MDVETYRQQIEQMKQELSESQAESATLREALKMADQELARQNEVLDSFSVVFSPVLLGVLLPR